MSSVAQQSRKPKAGGGGFLTALLEIALSFGVYYLLRAFGVDVFWALIAPAIAVLAVVVFVTIRRRRIDLVGLLVLCELAATITLSLVTQSARIAALREPVYFFVGGVFCLVTLFYRTPLSHVSTSSIATFGDPKREKAFQDAWQNVPRYGMWQRLITTSLGVIIIIAALVKAYVIYSAPADQISHAVNVSNIISIVMVGALVVASAILIQPARKIIEQLLERM